MPNVEEYEIYRTVLESLETGVYVLDRHGKILLWNRGAARITGYLQHEVLGRPCQDNVLAQCKLEGCVACRGNCPFSRALQDGRPRECHLQLRHKQGHPVSVAMRIAPVRDVHGVIIGLAQSFDEHNNISPINERDQYNLAAHGALDEATEIPNHGYMQFHLRENFAGFEEYHVPFGVMLFKLHHLSEFRSVYGHHAGDAILRVVAQTVRGSLRPGDILGRWTEEQFLAVLPNCGLTGARMAGSRIEKLVNYAKLQWWGDQLSVTTSVAYTAVRSGDTLDSLVQRAEQGLETHSSAGTGDYALKSLAHGKS
jgi:diguanylate cyclase (GGDEF)-like protein/PAS domain S-box-containing protein